MPVRPPSSRLAWGFAALAAALAVLHGLGAWFRVDEVTLGLLALAGLPVLALYVEAFKGGGVELRFRALSQAQQIAAFLEAVASRSAWTFYEPRPGESHMGQAFRVLVEEMQRTDSEAFHSMVRRCMESEDVNLRYFAAEVIGCFRIAPLRPLLQKGLGDHDKAARWPLWRLNCLWAESRFDGYASLHRFLRETADKENQDWLIDIYRQMPAAGEADAAAFARELRLFFARTDLDPATREEARRTAESLESSVKGTPAAGGVEKAAEAATERPAMVAAEVISVTPGKPR